MRVIAFDSTGPIVTVGAADGGNALAREDSLSVRGKGNLLEGLIDSVLKRAGWQRNDVEAIALVTGPGSLTGTRIGWATAAGWAHALDIPVTGWPVAEVHRRVLAGSRVNAACCVHFRAEVFLLYDLDEPNSVNVARSISIRDPNPTGAAPSFLTGPGLIGYRDQWREMFGAKSVFADDSDCIVGGARLAIMGEHDLVAGQTLPLDQSPLDYGLPPDFKRMTSA